VLRKTATFQLAPGQQFKIQLFSACGMRLRIIHGFFDSERIVLRFTPLMDFALAAAWPA
jgi:hypothetical protein